MAGDDQATIRAGGGDRPVATAHRARHGWDLDLDPRGGDTATVGQVLGEVIEAAGDRTNPDRDRASTGTGSAPVRWVVSHPDESTDALAARAGLTRRRDLLQMRCRLPVPDELRRRHGVADLGVRPFRPGVDDAAWLATNNAAFAEHPDQGGQGPGDLAATLAEDWVEVAGFLVLDAADETRRAAGALDGFCWTKTHAGASPPLGEIFAIGVDPAAQGRGLGPALTLAGLDHLAGRGLSVGMLYVDEDNTGAVAMYERLGLTTDHRDRMYQPG